MRATLEGPPENCLTDSTSRNTLHCTVYSLSPMASSNSKNSKSAKPAKAPIAVYSPLALYNLVSSLGWGYILWQVVSHYPRVGQPQFFRDTHCSVIIVQCFAVVEILNSLLGIVRSPLLTTAAQVASRLLVVLGIFYLLPETPAARGIAYVTLLLAWATTEIVRYLYYFCSLTGPAGAATPRPLVYLRYNMFWVLYPMGVASELAIIYSSLPSARAQYGRWYELALVFSMLTYIPGLPMLFMHMVAQRKKVMRSLAGDSKKLH